MPAIKRYKVYMRNIVDGSRAHCFVETAVMIPGDDSDESIREKAKEKMGTKYQVIRYHQVRRNQS